MLFGTVSDAQNLAWSPQRRGDPPIASAPDGQAPANQPDKEAGAAQPAGRPGNLMRAISAVPSPDQPGRFFGARVANAVNGTGERVRAWM